MKFQSVIFATATALLQAHTVDTTASCDSDMAARGGALLQISKAKGVEKVSQSKVVEKSAICSYQLTGDQDGSQPCASLQKGTYTSGSDANLDEAGYQEIAKLCCHHEMSLFARREIKAQGFDVCDLPDLHGFIHWYDCSDATKTGDDTKTFAKMQAEIAGNEASNCPFLGHLPNCPVQGVNCHEFPPCSASIPAGAKEGSTADLDEAGFDAVTLMCCHDDMEAFVRREIAKPGNDFKVCDEGALQGFLHWYDCTNDGQTYEKLKEGIVIARSGLPPMCPWLGSVGEDCPPTGHNCPWVEVPEPEAHRRRVACR